MNCKDCKHFKRFEKDWYNKNYGRCNCDKFEYGSSREYAVNVKETDKLFFRDNDNYSANFEVGENFGCIFFENILKEVNK